jgi:hypothetical protein
MAILERVTITGADDTVSPTHLLQVSAAYPFVEWGVLVSATNSSVPRYPSQLWRSLLADAMAANESSLNVSVHVQGRWLRNLLLGDKEDLVVGGGRLLKLAQRVQLNFHGAALDYDETKFLIELMAMPLAHGFTKQFLFQVDGNQGLPLLQRVMQYHTGLDLVALHDTSHGAGILPEEWPVFYAQTDKPGLQIGYAGGLGPDNLAEQIPLIAKAAGKCRIWIDMEKKVRSVGLGYDYFDIDKVVKALEVCEPFIGKEI